jgi:hypothetical protein
MHVWLATTPSLIGSEDMYHMVCSVNMQVITESQNLDRWYQLLVGRASARARSTSVTVDSLLPPPPPPLPLNPPSPAVYSIRPRTRICDTPSR